MKVDGRGIAQAITQLLSKEVTQLKKKKKLPRLVTILVGQSSEQESFVAIKKKIAKKIRVDFEFLYLKQLPSFEQFALVLKKFASEKNTKGIIIQQPLPPHLQTETFYNYLPLEKEIEGHKHKSTFYPPLGLAVLTIIKYVYGKGKIDKDIMVNMKKDKNFFRRVLKDKNIVLVGKGITGGKPIGKTLSELRINYLNIHSRNENPEEFYRSADIIISAVGKKVIDPSMLKPGVLLIGVGMRKEGNGIKGDYDEQEIKDVAGFYTSTPGGIGPLDVLYLYHNLIEATKMQK